MSAFELPDGGAHPLAGQTVALVGTGASLGAEIRVEDYWHRVSGESWMFMTGNPACLQYAIRSAVSDLPLDNRVVYGKVGHLGHLVHVTELGEPAPVAVQS